MPSATPPPLREQTPPWLKLDCREYRGDRPCAAGIQGICPADCARYVPLGQRILVIKLGALGDVIRTAALLPGLKKVWPHSQITWSTRPAGVRMLAHHPLIDRRLPLNAEPRCHLDHDRFGLCLIPAKAPENSIPGGEADALLAKLVTESPVWLCWSDSSYTKTQWKLFLSLVDAPSTNIEFIVR